MKQREADNLIAQLYIIIGRLEGLGVATDIHMPITFRSMEALKQQDRRENNGQGD